MWKLSFFMCALASTLALAEHDSPSPKTGTRPLAKAAKQVEAEHPERTCVRSAKYPKHLKFNEDGTSLLLTAGSGFQTFSVEKGVPPKLKSSSELSRHNLGLGSRDVYGLDDFSPDGKKLAMITMEYENESGRAKGYFLGVYSNDGKEVFFDRRIGEPPYPILLKFSADGKSIRYGKDVYDAESGNRIDKNQKFEAAAANQIPVTRMDKTMPTKLDFFETESATDPKFSVEVRRELEEKGSSFGYSAAVSPDRSLAAVAYYGEHGFEVCLFNLPAK